MFERFTDGARRVVLLAQEEARLLQHDHIGSEHLLLALVRDGDGPAAQALAEAGVELESARTRVGTTLGMGKQPTAGHIPFTPGAKKSLELSLRESLQLRHDYIGAGHLLLGVLRNDDTACDILTDLGVDPAELLERLRQTLAESVAVPSLHTVATVDLADRLTAIEQRLNSMAKNQAAIIDRLDRLDRGVGDAE